MQEHAPAQWEEAAPSLAHFLQLEEPVAVGAS